MGKSNKEIAAEMRVEVQTVKNAVSRLYRKLGVRVRADAVRWAMQEGITDEPRPFVPTPSQ